MDSVIPQFYQGMIVGGVIGLFLGLCIFLGIVLYFLKPLARHVP